VGAGLTATFSPVACQTCYAKRRARLSQPRRDRLLPPSRPQLGLCGPVRAHRRNDVVRGAQPDQGRAALGVGGRLCADLRRRPAGDGGGAGGLADARPDRGRCGRPALASLRRLEVGAVGGSSRLLRPAPVTGAGAAQSILGGHQNGGRQRPVQQRLDRCRCAPGAGGTAGSERRRAAVGPARQPPLRLLAARLPVRHLAEHLDAARSPEAGLDRAWLPAHPTFAAGDEPGGTGGLGCDTGGAGRLCPAHRVSRRFLPDAARSISGGGAAQSGAHHGGHERDRL